MFTTKIRTIIAVLVALTALTGTGVASAATRSAHHGHQQPKHARSVSRVVKRGGAPDRQADCHRQHLRRDLRLPHRRQRQWHRGDLRSLERATE